MMRKMKFFGLLLSFLLLIGTGIGLSAAFGDITVKLTYFVDNEHFQQAEFTQAHGTTLTNNAPLNVDDSGDFNYWLVNGILRTDLERNLSIVTRSTTELVAVYGHPTNPTVTFIDSNGKYIEHLFVESGSVVASVPAAPGKPQSTFTGWKGLGSSVVITDPITSNTVFIATYTENAVTAELVVDGGTPTTYPINSVVSLTLGEGFTHWEDGDGNVLSYAETFKFSMLVANREVVRATGGVKAPVVNMIAEPNLRTGYTSYVGQFEMPEGYELVEYGFIISRSKDILTIDSLGATIIPSNVYNEQTNEFLRSFPADSYNSIRAYAVFNDGTKQVYEYSDKMIGATTEEQIIYETGFEAPDFTAATQYSQPEALKGPVGLQWAVRYGTPATTSAISGVQSLQMRWYTTAPTTPIYAYTAFQSTNATKITFSSANNGQGGNVEVAISVDGGTTWIAPEVFTLAKTKAEFTYNVPEANQTGAVQFKFTYVVTDPIPTADDRLYIDDVKIYGGSQSTAKHEIVTIIDGVSTTSFVSEGSSIPNPTKDGYTFAGWYLKDTFETEFTGEVKQSLKLYAKFTIKSVTLTFDTDGGSLVDSITQNYGRAVTAPADPIKEGYTFVGWTPAIPTTMPAENQIFTAVWEANQYTVTFVTNGGSEVDSITQALGSEVTLPTTVKDGYNFNGWYSDITLETLVESLVMPLDGITLYAGWVKASLSSVVTFETNGGTPSTFTVTVTNGQPVGVPEEPTKEDHEFVGWYSDKDLTVEYVFSRFVTADMTLYAKWHQTAVEPIIVTAKYVGSTTTNMTAGNNAKIIGLDPTIFNVVSTQREPNPLHVGLNSAGQISLYGNENTNGNILTISIVPNFTIKEVEFEFGGTVGSALIMTDGTEAFRGSLVANRILFTELYIESFSIKNTNSSTDQIYILSIKISYVPKT